jgi:stage V sporulation protein SpoVS
MIATVKGVDMVVVCALVEVMIATVKGVDMVVVCALVEVMIATGEVVVDNLVVLEVVVF